MTQTHKIPFLPQEDFEWVESMVPITCIDIIVKENRKVLLGKRNTYPYKGLWHIPGGLLYFNETIKDAIKRIAKREIGLDVEIVNFLSIHEYIDEDPRGHFIGLAYIVKSIGGKIIENEFNSDLQFFDNVPYDAIPCQKEIIRDALWR